MLYGAVLPDQRGRKGVAISELLKALERHLPALGVFQMQTQMSEGKHCDLKFFAAARFCGDVATSELSSERP